MQHLSRIVVGVFGFVLPLAVACSSFTSAPLPDPGADGAVTSADSSTVDPALEAGPTATFDAEALEAVLAALRLGSCDGWTKHFAMFAATPGGGTTPSGCRLCPTSKTAVASVSFAIPVAAVAYTIQATLLGTPSTGVSIGFAVGDRDVALAKAPMTGKEQQAEQSYVATSNDTGLAVTIATTSSDEDVCVDVTEIKISFRQ